MAMGNPMAIGLPMAMGFPMDRGFPMATRMYGIPKSLDPTDTGFPCSFLVDVYGFLLKKVLK